MSDRLVTAMSLNVELVRYESLSNVIKVCRAIK